MALAMRFFCICPSERKPPKEIAIAKRNGCHIKEERDARLFAGHDVEFVGQAEHHIAAYAVSAAEVHRGGVDCVTASCHRVWWQMHCCAQCSQPYYCPHFDFYPKKCAKNIL